MMDRDDNEALPKTIAELARRLEAELDPVWRLLVLGTDPSQLDEFSSYLPIRNHFYFLSREPYLICDRDDRRTQVLQELRKNLEAASTPKERERAKRLRIAHDVRVIALREKEDASENMWGEKKWGEGILWIAWRLPPPSLRIFMQVMEENPE